MRPKPASTSTLSLTTISWAIRRVVSATPASSLTMTSTLRPATVVPFCACQSLIAASICLPVDADWPVMGRMKPILNGALFCACAGRRQRGSDGERREGGAKCLAAIHERSFEFGGFADSVATTPALPIGTFVNDAEALAYHGPAPALACPPTRERHDDPHPPAVPRRPRRQLPATQAPARGARAKGARRDHARGAARRRGRRDRRDRQVPGRRRPARASPTASSGAPTSTSTSSSSSAASRPTSR